MPPVSPPPCRQFLAAAAARHTAWLAASGLAARTRRTYGQQVHGYLAWLEGQPQLAARFRGTVSRRWYAESRGVLTARELGAEETAARQRAASRAAGLYHDHLLCRGAAAATIKLAMSAAGSLYCALGLQPPLIEDRVTTRPYKRPRTLSAPERARAVAAAAQRSTRDHALTALAADAGLRPGRSSRPTWRT